jgi:hypothetical protein
MEECKPALLRCKTWEANKDEIYFQGKPATGNGTFPWNLTDPRSP